VADNSSDNDPAGAQLPPPGIVENVRTSPQSEPAGPDWSQRLRAQSNKLAFVCVVAAIVGFAKYAHGIHPLGDWLTFYWARAWLWVALFGFASLASGLTVLARLKAYAGSVVERTNIALALGVLTFALGIYVAGLFGLLGLPFFLAWPVLQLLLGRRALLRYFRVLARQWSKVGPALFFPQSLIQALAVLGIVAGAFAIYVQVLAPANIGFDARFYHVPLAEGYAAAGRIRALPEGWYLGAYPHLASWLYTWAFLAPGVLKHHLCLASHLEFALVLLTVSNTSALASRLISGARLRHGGVALFLFPAIFNVSSNLSLGADHALAFWAAPLGLALLRYLTTPSVRQGALLGILVGGATLTKYQAIFLVVPIAMVLALNLLRDRQFRPLLVAAGAAIVVSSPFWLKNAIAYGDPFYPNLYRWLPDHPFFPGAGDRLAKVFYSGGPDPSLPGMQKLRDTLRALVDYSFHPLGFAMAPDSSTVVGSLFTLLLPLMLWVRPRWRVLLLVGCVHVALALWWRTLPASRYLQAFMPWMAACVAAALATAWRTKSMALRGAVVTLVGLQVIWGGDTYLIRSHEMLGALPLRAAGIAGEEHPFPRNDYPEARLSEIGARLPKGAQLVVHDFYQSIGVGVQTISDNPDWQGAIDYLQIDQPEQVLHRWLTLGGTHLLWPFSKENRAPEDLARDTVFGRASVAFTDSSFSVAGYQVAQIVNRPAPASMQNRTLLAWLGCGGDRTLGVYTPAGFASGTLEKPLAHDQLKSDPTLALAEVNTLWFRWDCKDSKAILPIISEQFTKVMTTGPYELWVRIPRDAAAVQPPK